jgi:hypothetical protein
VNLGKIASFDFGNLADHLFGGITMTTISLPPVETKRSSGKLALWLGILLVLSGPLIYIWQFNAKLLAVPWYAPALSTVGIVLILASIWQKRSFWRISVLVLFGLVAAIQWLFVLGSKVPSYNGPAVAGASMPAFAAQLADGSGFDQESLKGKQNTVMVFFRGRW